MPNESTWSSYIDSIVIHAKSDNLDEIAKTVYGINPSKNFSCDGYELTKALTQINNVDDSDADTLIAIYDTLLKYSNIPEYSNIVSKLAIKLMSGRKIDTIASFINDSRESIQNTLAPLTKTGGD